jgi:cytochrome c2
MISRFAVAASLAFALAACGSNDQAPGGEPSGEPTSAVPAAVPSEASPDATPAPDASASPTAAASEAGKHDDEHDDDDRPAGPPQAFNQCSACHSTTPGKTLIGPSLAGVYGHKAGQVAGFQFSDAMKNSGMVLNEKNLDAFLANPSAKVPGTIMAFAGIKDEEQREAIIDYLKTL